MAEKALFTVGVFGLAAKFTLGRVRIKVNVRTDQECQWQLAKLTPISGVQMVDCPGGTVQPGEKLLDTLAREVAEETGGCTMEHLEDAFSPPLVFVNSDPTKPGDIAVWMPILLRGDPKPTNEALSHPWISRAEFEAEVPYRCVSGLGRKGRTGQMISAAFDYFERFTRPGYAINVAVFSAVSDTVL